MENGSLVMEHGIGVAMSGQKHCTQMKGHCRNSGESGEALNKDEEGTDWRQNLEIKLEEHDGVQGGQ